MNTELLKRLKTFGWNLLYVVIAFAIEWIADNIGLLELPPLVTTMIGLLLAQVSKWWANHQNLVGKTFFGYRK